MRPFAVVLFFYFATLACGIGAAQAREFQLFQSVQLHSKTQSEYEKIVKELVEGDRVTFSDGTSFVLGEYQGEGNTTRIFAIEERSEGQSNGQSGRVIRIPSNNLRDRTTDFARDLIDEYARGADLLEKYGVPAPRVLAGSTREYLLVERLPDDSISLSRFLHMYRQLDHTEQLRAEKALREFARLAAGASKVRDGDARNIVYLPSQNRWVLIDFRIPVWSAFTANPSGVSVLDSADVVSTAIRDWAQLYGADRQFQTLVRSVQDAVADERSRILKEEPHRAAELAAFGRHTQNPPWPAQVQRPGPLRKAAATVLQGCIRFYEMAGRKTR